MVQSRHIQVACPPPSVIISYWQDCIRLPMQRLWTGLLLKGRLSKSIHYMFHYFNACDKGSDRHFLQSHYLPHLPSRLFCLIFSFLHQCSWVKPSSVQFLVLYFENNICRRWVKHMNKRKSYTTFISQKKVKVYISVIFVNNEMFIFLPYLPCNHVYFFLKVSPTVQNSAYSKESVYS